MIFCFLVIKRPMDVFSTSATAVSVLAALVTIISKLAAARVERRRDHTITDIKWWAGTDDGRHWIRGYVAEWAEARAGERAGHGSHGGHGGSHGSYNGGSHSDGECGGLNERADR